MQKISKHSLTIADREKVYGLKKIIGNFRTKRVLGRTEIKIQMLASKNKIKKKTPAVKESFFNILKESNQLSKRNALACTCRNPTGPESGPELDLSFLFIRKWNGTFANRPDFWFTFPYSPNSGPILGQFAVFFPYICVNATPLPVPTFWNGPVCINPLSKRCAKCCVGPGRIKKRAAHSENFLGGLVCTRNLAFRLQ